MLKLLQALCDRSLAKASDHDKRCQVFAAIGENVTDPQLFIPYVKALETAPPRVRPTLVQLIPKVNNLQAHDRVVELMRSPEKPVRLAAAAVMKEIGGKTIVQRLGRMVTEKQMLGREDGLDLLVDLAGHYAVTPLTDVALNKNLAADGRIHAIRHLGNPRYMAKATSRALNALSKVIDLREPAMLPVAITAYGNLCGEDDYFMTIAPFLEDDNLQLVKAAVISIQRFSSRRAMNALDRRLQLGPAAIRMAVLDTLERIGNDQVLATLVEALQLPELQVRTRATDILKKLSLSGKIDLSRTVIWLLRSKDQNLRRIAVELAQSVQNTESLWPKLLAFLRDEDWWVRERVVDALIEMAGTRLAEHIRGFLQDDTSVLRRFGIDVLSRMKDTASLDAMSHMALNDPDWWVRERALEALATIGGQAAAPRILEAMDRNPDLVVVGLFCLAEVGATGMAARIAQFLNTDDQEVQWAALKALSDTGTAAQLEAVKPFVNHPHRRIREMAQNLLAKWKVQVGSGVVEAKVSALDRFLQMMVEQKGDDLMLTSNERPFLKRLGQMIPLSENKLMGGFVTDLVSPLLTGAQLRRLEELDDVDLSYEVPATQQRFRVNVFYTAKGLCAVFRTVQDEIRSFDSLGLPEKVRGFGDYKNGLVLVGGPTGSGKSTTLAAVIDYINSKYDRHIISLEDPIEVVHKPKRSLVNQREVGTHINSYKNALRAALREDPDVLLIGELRDFDTISFAVTAAETGHLVFGTVHTVSAATTVDRLMNAFPTGQQEQVRSMLAESMRAVLCQHLVPRADGKGRVLATEVMLNNDAIAHLIRNGKAHQIPTTMLTSRSQGMVLMDDSLWNLYKAGIVTAEDVYLKAQNKSEFDARFEKEREVAEARQSGTPPPTAAAAKNA